MSNLIDNGIDVDTRMMINRILDETYKVNEKSNGDECKTDSEASRALAATEPKGDATCKNND